MYRHLTPEEEISTAVIGIVFVRMVLFHSDDKKDKKKEKKPLEAAPPSHVGRRKKPKGSVGASKLPNGEE